MTHKLSREECKPQPGQVFTLGGKTYVLGGEIGAGAVGLVCKATQFQKDKSGSPKSGSVLRAIKFLAPDPKYIDESAFDDVEARFKREGERGSRLEHPHLLRVLAFEPNSSGTSFGASGEGPSNPFILMEFLAGKTLEDYIRHLPTASRHAFQITKPRLSIAIQVAKSIKYLHGKKLIHRDIKPANIFLGNAHANVIFDDDGIASAEGDGIVDAKLGDFGIMKWGDFHAAISTGVLTATNQKELGTMKYMSPEQAVRPREVTVRSDMYSLGITLFELFTGQILAGPHHVFEVMMARMARGTTMSRFLEMGYSLDPGDNTIAEMILDMHLRGITSRPAIEKVVAVLSYEYERRFDDAWKLGLD